MDLDIFIVFFTEGLHVFIQLLLFGSQESSVNKMYLQGVKTLLF